MINKSVTKQFVLFALIFGFIFTVLIPPFQSPDEDSHFKKAYVVSKGQFFPTEKDGVIGYYLPDKMIATIEEKLTFIGDLEKKASYQDVLHGERDISGFQNFSFQSFSTTPTLFLGHIVPAAGILVGKVAGTIFGLDNFSTYYMLYFARIASLLFYVVVIALAIKITPAFKKTFMLIGLLPMSLALAATVTYDNLLIPLSMLAVALMLKLFLNEETKLNWKYLMAFTTIGLVFLNIKSAYSVILVPLICLLFNKKFELKSTLKFIFILGIAILGITFILKMPIPVANSNVEGVSLSSQQISYMMSHPGGVLTALYNEIFLNRFFYLSGMVGIFGLLDTYLPVYVYIFTIIAFVGLAFLDANSYVNRISGFIKGTTVFSFVIGVLGIFLAFYILWTPYISGFGVGATAISGVQGRYFIPLLALVPLMLQSYRLAGLNVIQKYKDRILNNSFFLPLATLSITVFTLIFRFWAV